MATRTQCGTAITRLINGSRWRAGCAVLATLAVVGTAHAGQTGDGAERINRGGKPSSSLQPRPALVYHFAIAAGPLETVIAAFEAMTEIAVEFPPIPAVRTIMSAGLLGEYPAADALDKLLAGTGVVSRLTASGAYVLELRIADETIEVVGSVAPYYAGESTTATKTATALRDIPQTLNVLPRELLADQHAQSIAAAMRNVPGVTVAQGEGNRDQIVIRGISTASDFFVNGIRDDQERFRDLYNVDRIEVLQGPAAVLFGRGGAGGVVNLVTRPPSRQSRSDVIVDLGSYGHKRATAQIGSGVGSTAAYRVSLMAEDSGGFRDGAFLRRYAVNPTMGFELGSATTLTIGFEHLQDTRLADRGIPSQAGRPVDVRSGQLFGSLNQNQARSADDTGYLRFEHRLSDRVTLRNSLLIGRYGKDYQNVYAGSAVTAEGTFSLSAYNHQIDRTNTFNQTDVIYDARIAGMTHRFLFGTELGRQLQDEHRHTAASITGVTVATSTRDADFATASLAVDRHATSNVAAGYAQDQIALSDHWKAVVGARTDRFAARVDDHLAVQPTLARADVATSPRAGVIYQPNALVSLYTSYSYTFLPSGQTLGLATNTAQLAPENAKNYEVGSKVDLLSQPLNISAALFRLDRNNVKNLDPNDPTKLALTGQQRTEGLTLSASGSLGPRWTIYGGYAGLRARITRDTSSAPSGRRVGLVPRSQFSLWSTYDLSDRWGGGGGVLSQSRMFASFSNQVALPGFTRVDAMVYYRVHGLRIALNAENVLDTKYYATANGDNNISPGAPRSINLTCRVDF